MKMADYLTVGYNMKHIHKYGKVQDDGYQYCKICGKAIKPRTFTTIVRNIVDRSCHSDYGHCVGDGDQGGSSGHCR